MSNRGVATLAVLFVLPLAAEPPLSTTDIHAADIEAFIKSLPRDKSADKPIRVVDVGGYKVGVYGVFRPLGSKGTAVAHKTKIAEVYEIILGAGTLVTGGKIVDAKEEKAELGFSNLVGTRIEGGVTRRVAKGDIIIIPGGVPHWWSHLEGDVAYLVTRTDPNGELTLR
jgi:mannose-6-phosphate isomerase-like protein (cupin superfamily)